MYEKILLANTSFYPSVGGVENSLRSLSEEFTRQGMDVTVIASDEGRLPSKELLFGAKIHRYKHIPLFGYLISIALLLIKLNHSSFDLVISRHLATTFVLLLLGNKKVKYIAPGVYKHQNVGLKDSFLGGLKYYLNCSLERYVLKNTPDIYVFSNTMESQVGELRATDIKRLFPGVDSSRFHQASLSVKDEIKREQGIPVDKKVIFTIGRFVDVKNFSLAIEALKYLDENIVLLLVGDGPLKEDLKVQANKLGLGNRVIFKSSTPTPELYFKVADVFLLTSTYEPFGQVLLEASASKLPVVAIDSSIDGVQTATKEIYNNFGSLVYFSESSTPKDYSFSINCAIEGSIEDLHFSLFLERYSWSNIALKLLS